MGWSYRKRKGNLGFSLSSRGPRVSLGLGGKSGCLLPVAVFTLLASALIALSR